MQVIYRRKMNQVILVGRAKSKPVIKETASKIQLGQLLIEVQKPYSNAEGIYETETFAVTLWRSLVEECVKEINVNSTVAIRGRLQANNYRKDDGDVIYRNEIIAEKVSILK